jgi:hypothetical protein
VKVGLLLLESTYMTVPGGMGHPDTFDFPTERVRVDGAQTSVVVSDGYGSLADVYVAAAKEMGQRGADIVATNCGFTVVFQDAIAEATGLPTFTSALLLAPLLARMYSNRLGILSFDASSIDAARRQAAGWPADLILPIADVQSSSEWRKLRDVQTPDLDHVRMKEDLLEIAADFVRETDVGALLIECTAMLPFETALYETVGLPMYDSPAILKLLVDRTNGVGLTDQIRSAKSTH